MKKACILTTLFLIFLLAPITLAVENQTQKAEEGFACLESKAGDCSGLTTQETALTILATPDNIFNYCVDELKSRNNSNNWGNIRDTALAILALKHAGEDTTASEKWLISQNKTPTDLIWYLQQDSNKATNCSIGYDSQDFTINIGVDKKINQDAGSCLELAQSNFWLQINENCYDETFQIECDQSFIANLIYRNRDSPTLYVLEGTESSPAFGSIDLSLNSKCFGDGACDYESTIWAALALLNAGHDIDEFIPYIIAMSDTNEQYLPDAFIYMLTDYNDNANKLIQSQKLGNYWEATSSANNKYYDTSLALLALYGSTSEQAQSAKDWMWFSQETNGCWQSEIKETAIALWALEGRAGKIPKKLIINKTDPAAPTITLNSPSSANYATAQNLVINFTASDDINLLSVKLYVNDVLKQTNSSGINNSIYLFNLNLNNGSYIIKGIATDSNSKTTNSSEITIIIGNASKGSSVTYCTDANYFCISSSECPASDNVGDSYFCPSLSKTCCKTESLMTCSEYSGKICSTTEVCTGNSKKASDTNECCTGSCQERSQENECESNFYTCMSSCSEFQEAVSAYSCDGSEVCCKTKAKTGSEEVASRWWIWVLLILIIVVLAAIGYVYREQLKLYWFQLQSKFKKDEDRGKGGFPPRGPGIPPRPGFPPIRRPIRQGTPNRQRAPIRRPQNGRDKAMSETFKKLSDMSK